MINEDFRKRIEEELVTDHANALEKNFEIVKDFIRITSSGTIEVFEKEKLTGPDKILLYLIGKVYAKEVGKTDSEFVVNKELQDELGIKKGSLLPWLKTLRDKNLIDGKKGKQKVKINLIGSTLIRINNQQKNE